ncbi:aarA [Symbiodinium necroappetens]|uniref:AarA protein n=1 Tax=Symbiodinium necroappetens TaxID=1628268 RepID=A0A813CH59_9DINO|nr:aarA [Symbiodinium necroappetens]
MVTVCVRFEVSLGAVPLLARALENYPDDPELQERGLDVLRVIATGGRLPDVEDSLSYLGAVPMLVKVMNLNIARPKIQEYGLTLLSEIGWQGGDRQLEILLEDGVEVTVRALRAFPAERDVQLHGLAAVQALTTGNEECRVRFFTLADILEIVMEAMANFPLVEGIQAHSAFGSYFPGSVVQKVVTGDEQQTVTLQSY